MEFGTAVFKGAIRRRRSTRALKFGAPGPSRTALGHGLKCSQRAKAVRSSSDCCRPRGVRDYGNGPAVFPPTPSQSWYRVSAPTTAPFVVTGGRDLLCSDGKGLAMPTSKMIAGLIGPTLVAIAAAVLINFGSFPALAEQISRDPALIFVSGILLLIAGLAIVRTHNIWAGGWPVLVTVLGWLAVLGGFVRMLFPIQLAAILAGIGQKTGLIAAVAVVLL